MFTPPTVLSYYTHLTSLYLASGPKSTAPLGHSRPACTSSKDHVTAIPWSQLGLRSHGISCTRGSSICRRTLRPLGLNMTTDCSSRHSTSCHKLTQSSKCVSRAPASFDISPTGSQQVGFHLKGLSPAASLESLPSGNEVSITAQNVSAGRLDALQKPAPAAKWAPAHMYSVAYAGLRGVCSLSQQLQGGPFKPECSLAIAACTATHAGPCSRLAKSQGAISAAGLHAS